MLDITVIILTFNEEIHIKRCIGNVRSIAKKIVVVDSFSTDKTVEIASSLGAEVILHKWPGNHAKQINWALENITVDTTWTLRLDADEYLTKELIDEMLYKIPKIKDTVSAIVLPLKRFFLDKEIKHGNNNVSMIRLFKQGKSVCEQLWMDEHMLVTEGEIEEFENCFVDDNINTISFFTDKHNSYSIREAIVTLDYEYNLISDKGNSGKLCNRAKSKKAQKNIYASMPLFWRAFLYFCLRYFIKGGFLDGKEGFLWHFLQGWWYRTIVDAKIFEIKKRCGNDKEKIKTYIIENYNIDL